MLRIGIASIMQETNSWAPEPCTLEDFTCHGLHVGTEMEEHYRGTNTEIGGALDVVMDRGAEPVPLVRAWAMPSGRLTARAFRELRRRLLDAVGNAAPLDGLILSLHGAMAADGVDDADGALVAAARGAVGPHVPIGVCLDLHANVTPNLIAHSDIVVGYRTQPHVDQAETGARVAHLLLDTLSGGPRPRCAVAKSPLLVPAESMSTTEGPLRELWDDAHTLADGAVLDLSLFPVQPWLDVEELGFGVVVTTAADGAAAACLAERVADLAWRRRETFTVDLVPPPEALDRARRSPVRPFLLSESADSPSAGAPGDSPAALRALGDHGPDLRSFMTLVDAAGVDRAHGSGAGGRFSAYVGASIDRRFHTPVLMEGTVERIGHDPVRLTGPSFTGMEVSMGRWAVVRTRNVSVLLTQRPAWTIDPVTFRHVGLDPDRADVIVVRSPLMYRAAYPARSAAEAVTLDLPGVSTPRLELLNFERAPRPLFPLDPETRELTATHDR